MEMECIFTTKEVDNGMEMERKWNGNGMEILLQKRSMQNGREMEWKRNGNGMERLCQAVVLIFGSGNGMEWKWKWKRNPRFVVWNFHVENF